MSRIWTVARRELKALFDHPTGYILAIVFVGVNDFLFFRQAFLVGAASLRPMFDLLPWMLLFLVPAVTMRTVADDTRTGTIEVVLAQPITELELLLGKYLGALLFLWLTLALTLPIPIGLALGAELPWGVVIAQYVGGFLLVAGLAAVGVWTSSLTRNQITAFIVGVAVMFGLVLVGLDPLIVGLPPRLGALAARLGVLSHFANIGRGVIDLRDAVYFASLAAMFLTLAYAALLGRRIPPGAPAARRLQMGTAALVVIVVVVNLLGGYLRGRLDLTPGNAYTLSPATRELVRELDDLVTVRLFVSRELPPEVSLLKRDVDDLLRDLKTASGGTVRVIASDPAESDEARQEAQSFGVPPIQFNVIGQAQLQIKEGYMGLAVQYADKQEAIPVIQRTDDLEYKLASAIKGMTRTGKPAIGLVTNPGDEYVRQRTFNSLREGLGQAYDVRSVSLADSTPLPDDLRVLVLAAAPDSPVPNDTATARLRDFLANGGGVLMMAGGTTIDPQQPYFASPRPVAWNAVLSSFGVTIRSDLVYDLRSNEAVSLPTRFGRLLVSYPLWMRAGSTGASVVNQEITSLFLPWTSSIDTTGAQPGSVTPLYVSSPAAGVEAGQMFLDPQREFPQDSLSERLLAVQVNAGALGDSAAPRGRLIVVGNDDFASDRHLRSAPENGVFVLNAVDWLAQDEALIAIRSKDRRPPPLAFSPAEKTTVKYGNLVGVPVLLALFGLGRLVRRRRLMRLTYQPGPAALAPAGAAAPPALPHAGRSGTAS